MGGVKDYLSLYEVNVESHKLGSSLDRSLLLIYEATRIFYIDLTFDINKNTYIVCPLN